MTQAVPLRPHTPTRSSPPSTAGTTLIYLPAQNNFAPGSRLATLGRRIELLRLLPVRSNCSSSFILIFKSQN
jgi:hypothetical protein